VSHGVTLGRERSTSVTARSYEKGAPVVACPAPVILVAGQRLCVTPYGYRGVPRTGDAPRPTSLVAVAAKTTPWRDDPDSLAS